MKRLLHFRLPFFLAPDAGATGGAAAAVVDAAAPDPVAADILSYEPPDAGDVADLLTGESNALPEKKDPPAKKEGGDKAATDKAAADAKAAADKKAADEAAATAGDKKKGEGPGPKALREGIDKAHAQIKELEKQLEGARSDKRVEELTAQIAEKEKAITDRTQALEAAERKLLVHNPLVSRRLTDLRGGFNKEFAKTVEMIPALKGQYPALLNELAAIASDETDYAENLKAFRGKLKEQFDDDAPDVLAALRKGIQFRADHARLAEEVQRDAVKIEFEARKSEWEAGHKRFDTEYAKWLEPPADAATTDPLNHRLFFKNFEAALPKEEVAKVDTNVKVFLDRLFNGAQPRTKEDFPGMSDDQIAAEMQRIEGAVKKDREMAPALIAQGLKALAYFRPIMAKLQQLEKAADAKREAAPSDATKNGAGDSKKGEEEIPSAESVAAGMFS